MTEATLQCGTLKMANKFTDMVMLMDLIKRLRRAALIILSGVYLQLAVMAVAKYGTIIVVLN